MSRKVIVFIATSLDGYIATQDDNLEWFLSSEGNGDNGYESFYNTVDTILLGRKTYDWILREVGKDHFPYRGKRCCVFTSTPAEKLDSVEFISENVVSFTQRLRLEEGGNIWVVGGGKLIRGLRENHMIDEWIVTIAPTLLGNGIPHFYPNDKEERLRLVDIQRYQQFVMLDYLVQHSSDSKVSDNGNS